MSEASQCADKKLPENSNADLGLISKKWNDNKLEIETYYRTICGGGELRGWYKIKDTTITIFYNTKIVGPATKCKCPHFLNHTLSDLEKKEYSFNFIEE